MFVLLNKCFNCGFWTIHVFHTLILIKVMCCFAAPSISPCLSVIVIRQLQCTVSTISCARCREIFSRLGLAIENQFLKEKNYCSEHWYFFTWTHKVMLTAGNNRTCEKNVKSSYSYEKLLCVITNALSMNVDG